MVAIPFAANPTERMALTITAASHRSSDRFAELISHLETLPDLCLENILDILSLKKIIRISIASNRLKEFSSDYFRRKFKTKEIAIKVKNNKIVCSASPKDDYSLFFGDAVQRINIFGSIFESLRSINGNYRPAKITFKSLIPINNSMPFDALEGPLEGVLTEVRSMEFIFNRLDGKILDGVLQHANNIKTLAIVSPTKPEPNYGANWFKWTMPTLKGLHWDDGVINNRHQFQQFINNNPQIDTLKITRNLQSAINTIENTDIRLNQLILGISWLESQQMIGSDAIFSKLNELHGEQKFIEVHLRFESPGFLIANGKVLKKLRGLTSITMRCEYHPTIGKVKNLKELSVRRIPAGIDPSKQLKSLEKLHIEECSLNAIVPFIKNNHNLKRIVVERVIGDIQLEMKDLISHRMQCTGGGPIRVYLEERAYLKLKKYSTQPVIINIQRAESIEFGF